MIDSVMLWNEPNNKSHWDPEVDPDWSRFATMIALAARAIGDAAPGLTRVLGGISPIDPSFLQRLDGHGALRDIDVIAVHGFPLDWNLWQIDEWPAKLGEIRAATAKPLWVTEVGVSSFGAEEVQAWGVARTAELLRGRVPRIHWYSLHDLPRDWEATTRHREAEGSSYYRHFHMGLIREDGTPKPGLAEFARHTPALGLCQWFHFEDPRLEASVARMQDLGVRQLRTGVSWADWLRPGGEAWMDRLVRAIEPFEVTATFCFTPEALGIRPHHTSAPRDLETYAAFCVEMVRRYASPGSLEQRGITVGTADTVVSLRT
ncbi:MAG: glycosyl hydrolase [Gemmatimonadaceae bacterium]|jgi:beta-xylosidase|nr:glycosyl hydrolase [Gemmatimonadaceae bacterium]